MDRQQRREQGAQRIGGEGGEMGRTLGGGAASLPRRANAAVQELKMLMRTLVKTMVLMPV